ncbi:hypothetical protein CEXT_624761 [Caerostris extrusa]|uniref:Ycf15 n=1 Tax=Caerostris extrusa TaxID=172846 RepID=A0AAV4TP92_CAEEX|nr:hypothetical protein CEXT_624761 [Caerostris extrusa]
MKIFRIRILTEDIQIGDRTLGAEELEANNSILAPWEKLKFGWRYLRPEEQLRKPHTPSNSVKQESQEGCGGNYEDEATEDFRNNPRVVLEGSSHLIFSTA